ncbi:hypothetical protein NFI95_11975 [Acetobacteraceae bacterium KSS8]|uniref:Tetratricopeptide repeat protein n=1 Tax=Endosaccharibacter trunci TaxID=2812733 RepID=A0ABT1W8E1_9PROT|nr:hypothetical protein [Acetobacteraceae bacterium KSS8]
MTVRLSHAALLLLASAAVAAPAFADPLRPEVGKPLQRAQAELRKHDYAAAMRDVNVADGVKNKTADESYVIAQMRAAVAQSSGNTADAIKADDALIDSSRTSSAEKTRLLMAEASMAYNAKDYPRAISAIERYFKAGGSDPAMHTILIQSYYLQKDYPNAAKAQERQIAQEEKAGQKPTENQLQLLASTQQQAKDMDGFNATMVKLVQDYPKPEYWANLIHGLRTNPNVSDRLAYDVDRIRLAVGLLTSTADFMDMAELATQQGLPMQGQKVMAAGYASGALGKDAGAAREARLKALIDRTAAETKANLAKSEAAALASPTGGELLTVGYNYVDAGQAAKGIDLMKQGIAKGGLASKDDALLHLGLAEMDAGMKADAIRTLKTVGGNDGAAELAQLWILQINKH